MAFDWLVARWNWPGAAAFSGVMLLALAPVVWVWAGEFVFWIYLQLPIYQLHQIEEHAGDRFRRVVNETIGGGVEVLSRPATFVINSVGVWVVDLVAIYLAVFVESGWGLMAFYLPLINAVGHIGQALALRRSNPGIWTALFLFLPLAGWGLWVVTGSGGVTAMMQMVGLGVAVGVHAGIIVHVKRALARARRR